MTRSHLHIVLLLVTCFQAASCRIDPPLHLRQPVQTEIMLDAQVNVDLMWQVEWENEWVFPWAESTLGEVGYVLPTSMSLHMYPLDANGAHKAHTVNHFHGTKAQVAITTGVCDLLFHNNDSEALQFNAQDDLGDIYCTTRIISSGLKSSDPVKTPQQKAAASTKAPEDSSYTQDPVALMPDALFVLYKQNQVISDNKDDYEFIDGKYVLRIQGELEPATYIHLFQIHLLNNEGRVVGSNGGAALTGVAAGVDLQTRFTASNTVNVPMDMHFDRQSDILGARVITFGIPACDAYQLESVTRAPKGAHYLIVNVSYTGGRWRNIRIDVTDAFRSLPQGGVIDLSLDVNDFPPEGGNEGGGGFDALIDDWTEEEGTVTILN